MGVVNFLKFLVPACGVRALSPTAFIQASEDANVQTIIANVGKVQELLSQGAGSLPGVKFMTAAQKDGPQSTQNEFSFWHNFEVNDDPKLTFTTFSNTASSSSPYSWHAQQQPGNNVFINNVVNSLGLGDLKIKTTMIKTVDQLFQLVSMGLLHKEVREGQVDATKGLGNNRQGKAKKREEANRVVGLFLKTSVGDKEEFKEKMRATKVLDTLNEKIAADNSALKPGQKKKELYSEPTEVNGWKRLIFLFYGHAVPMPTGWEQLGQAVVLRILAARELEDKKNKPLEKYDGLPVMDHVSPQWANGSINVGADITGPIRNAASKMFTVNEQTDGAVVKVTGGFNASGYMLKCVGDILYNRECKYKDENVKSLNSALRAKIKESLEASTFDWATSTHLQYWVRLAFLKEDLFKEALKELGIQF